MNPIQKECDNIDSVCLGAYAEYLQNARADVYHQLSASYLSSLFQGYSILDDCFFFLFPPFIFGRGKCIPPASQDACVRAHVRSYDCPPVPIIILPSQPPPPS